MVKNTKTWISWQWNITFLSNEKILNLCLRWHILRSSCFAAEVTFKLKDENFVSITFVVEKKNVLSSEIFCRITKKSKQMNKERLLLKQTKLAEQCFLFYLVRNTLAITLNFLGTKTTRWTMAKFFCYWIIPCQVMQDWTWSISEFDKNLPSCYNTKIW